jgi:putative ABC transport system substrate-binding protein
VKRREFITLLGSAAAAWPVAARAQQAGKLPTIGFLGSATATTQAQWVTAFVQRLRELGWVDGRNIAVEYRWAEGRSERFAEIAAEFVRLNVDVIVTSGGPAYIIKKATSVIPIVFAVANDPVGSGLVISLARPGGNATGLSNQQTDTGGKRLELLRELLPSLRRLAVLADLANPSNVLDVREVQAAAQTLNVEVATWDIRGAEDIAPAFLALKGRTDALYVCSNPLFVNNRIRIGILAVGARIPAIYAGREHVDAGGLICYGPNFADQFRRAADFVDKILRGAKPADLPVEQPTKFEMVINLTTAMALGLEIPSTLLARADEVLE